MERKYYPTALRVLANFLEANPELPAPLFPSLVYVMTKEEMLKVARVRGARKNYTELYFGVEIPLAANLTIRYYTGRDVVCTAKRTETITEPAREAHTYEKVVEWDCHPLLQPDEPAPMVPNNNENEIPF